MRRRLIAVDEAKLELVMAALKPVALQLQLDGRTEEAAEVVSLTRYLRSKVETAPTIPTAASIGRKGGHSRSPRKLDQARENAKYAGPPGTYYACLVLEVIDGEKQVVHYKFPNKRRRDEWLSGPGTREKVLTSDPDLRALKLRDPEGLADGDPKLKAEYEDDERHMQFERVSDTTEYCDGCRHLEERKYLAFIGNNRLCSTCTGSIRFLQDRQAILLDDFPHVP